MGHRAYGPTMEFQPDVPRWRQVRDVIAQRIAAGVYPPGTRLPSVIQLQAEFGIATSTGQKVMKALRADGLAFTEPGLGSFVTKVPRSN